MKFEDKLDDIFGEGIKKLNLKQLIKKAGKIDLSPLNNNDVIKIQWMRAKEGGQKFGNREYIFELTFDNFKQFILPAIKSHSIPLLKNIKNEGDYETLMSTIRSKIPEEDSKRIFMKVFSWDKDGKLRTVTPDESPLATEETIPYYANLDNKWALQVKDFESPEAKQWGETADSDVYANADPEDKTLK